MNKWEQDDLNARLRARALNINTTIERDDDDDDPPHSNDCPRAMLSSAECLCPAQDASRYRDEE